MNEINKITIPKGLIWGLSIALMLMAGAIPLTAQETHYIPNDEPDSLEHFLEKRNSETNEPLYWQSGDVVVLTSASEYIVNGTIDLYEEVTIMGDPSLSSRPILRLYDNGFRAKEDSINITIKGVNFNGLKENGEDKAAYILRFDDANYKNFKSILIEEVEAYNTQGGVQLYKNKNTLYESVTLNKVYFHDMGNQWCLDPTLNAVEELRITNSTFVNVFGVLKNPYFNKDGTGALGAVAQHVVIDHNTFFKVGGNGGALLQINDPNDGSVTLDFTNNVVSTVLDDTLSRPFLINEAAGTFTFSNSTVHEFDSERDAGDWNFSSVTAQANVSATAISTDYPNFRDTTSTGTISLLLPSDSPLQVAGTDGAPIGDPRWSGSSKMVTGGLEAFIENTDLWNPGDTILVTQDEIITGTIDIFQEVTIMGDPSLDRKPVLRFYDNGFRPKEDSIDITLKGLELNGLKEDGESTAGYILRFDQNNWYNYKNIRLEDVEAYHFTGGVQLTKNLKKHYESVTLDKVYIHDVLGDFVIDPRGNAVEELEITNSTFVNVKGLIKNLYNNNNGDAEFGAVAQHVTIDHNTFYHVVTDAFIQMNDGIDGSVTLAYTNNIASTLVDNANSRPFRINEAAGTFTFSNNLFHSFESERDEGVYNLEAVATAQENVSIADIQTVAPGFADAVNGDFNLSANSEGLIVDLDGDSYIGDPRWIPIVPGLSGERIHPIPNTPDSLDHFMSNTAYWNPGDTMLLVSAGTYLINGTIDIYQEVTIMGDPTLSVRPELRLYDNGFRAKEDSINITIKGVNFNGLKENGEDKAAYILRFDDANYKNFKSIVIEEVEAYNTQGGLQLYKNKNTLYESVVLNKVYFHDMGNQWCLDPTLNAVEELRITNSTFANVFGVLKNPYFNKDGTGALGVVEQHFVIDHNTFFKVGGNGGGLLQINDPNDGSVTLDFTNNVVSTVLNDTLSRPFRINEAAGTFTFTNSAIHNFDSERDAGIWNFSSVIAQDNVLSTDISAADPDFLKTDAPFNFTLPLNSSLLAFGTNDGPIGDPRWFPQVGVTIAELSEVLIERDEAQLEAVVTFGEGADLTVTWSVVNGYNDTSGEASISESGLITAVAAGDVAVIATSNFSTAYADTLVISIAPYVYVESISVKATNSFGTETAMITSKGGSLTVIATALPFGAPDKRFTWSLSDESLASILVINETSVVLTAEASGKVTVMATANDGSEVSGAIDIEMVNQRPVTAIAVSTEGDVAEVTKGATLQLMAAVQPEDADEDSVAWSVNKTDIATIDENGLLSAIGVGQVMVTASATDNSFKTSTLAVTVLQVLGANGLQLVKLFPNPSNDFIHISGLEKAQLEVVNLSGQTLISKSVTGKATLDLSSLRQGLYLLRITTSKDVQLMKFTRR